MTKILAASPFALALSAFVSVPSQASPRVEVGLTEAIPQGNAWGCDSKEKNGRVTACQASCRDNFDGARAACRASQRTCDDRCGNDGACKASCRDDLSECLAPLRGELESCRQSCVTSVEGCIYF